VKRFYTVCIVYLIFFTDRCWTGSCSKISFSLCLSHTSKACKW